MHDRTPLERALLRRIAVTGPISVADFMTEAMTQSARSYYRHSAAVGLHGDFVTAPEISQVFGELIGAWLADRWQALGCPEPVRLVELGPGRGTLMLDALRATRRVAGFHAALRLHLVEVNETLRRQQIDALTPHLPAGAIAWHERFADVPAGVLLLIANEFFDALPIRQLQATPDSWRERMIGIDGDTGRLRFALAPGPSPLAPLLPPDLGPVPPGTIVEISPQRTMLADEIARRVRVDGGWAMIVDYGRTQSGAGASLQAVRRHLPVDVFDRPGESDLSAHVDFAVLARAARDAGVTAWGPTSQAQLLCTLGVEARRAALTSRATVAQREAVEGAIQRLIDPQGMGNLFQALAIGPANSPPPPGFTS